jgi:hypothetical protein
METAAAPAISVAKRLQGNEHDIPGLDLRRRALRGGPTGRLVGNDGGMLAYYPPVGLVLMTTDAQS